MDMSRRSFIVSTTAAAAAGAALAQAQAEAQPAPAQPMPAPMPRGFNPSDPALKYELVIAGGEVLDPSLRLRGKRDIGIKNGQIAAVAASIPADRAVQRIDATGKLVTPGLIDLHTHLCPHLGLGLPADEMVGITCTTTAVSAGDAGANTWGAFQHLALPHSRTRLFAFVHISSIGLAGGLAPGEMLNIDYADVDRCAKVVSENPDTALGVKVRITDNVVGQNGLEPPRCDRPARQPGSRDAAAPATTRCRTASSCRRRWPPRSAGSSSTSATAAARSTSRWPSRRCNRACRPTRSRATSIRSASTRPAIPRSRG